MGREGNRPDSGRHSGGGGGGGGNRGRHDYPPPPPYSARPSDWGKGTPGAGPSSASHPYNTGSWWSRNGTEGAGFWQGLGVGGLVGAAAAGLWGRRAGREPPTMSATSRAAWPASSPRAYPRQGPVVDDDEYDWERRRGANDRSWSGLLGNFGSGSGSQLRSEDTTRRRSSGGPSSSEASSSTMRTSRGFGTTNVR